jgi:hypothetical protein
MDKKNLSDAKNLGVCEGSGKASGLAPLIPHPSSLIPHPGWALHLDRGDVAAAGRLRLVAGVEVCEQPDAIWLRGPQDPEELRRQLAAVARARRFSVLPDGQLLPIGARVPQGRLPPGPWEALTRWMGLEAPPAARAGRSGAAIALGLVRSERVEESTLLLTEFDVWAAYAVEAPQVRLDLWRFALAADGRVAIHGQRLPPLPGQRWVEREGIAVPAGWTWTPAVDARLVRQIFGLSAGDVALWHEDGAWERIAADAFVRATRAAVRETWKTRSPG